MSKQLKKSWWATSNFFSFWDKNPRRHSQKKKQSTKNKYKRRSNERFIYIFKNITHIATSYLHYFFWNEFLNFYFETLWRFKCAVVGFECLVSRVLALIIAHTILHGIFDWLFFFIDFTCVLVQTFLSFFFNLWGWKTLPICLETKMSLVIIILFFDTLWTRILEKLWKVHNLFDTILQKMSWNMKNKTLEFRFRHYRFLLKNLYIS